MRVAFKNMINGYYGKADDSIIYYIRKTNSFYIKKRPHMPRGDNQNRFQAIMLNLGRLNPDYYYKEDFSFYLELYNQLPNQRYGAVIAWNNLWLKVMFGLAKTVPGLDLATLTKPDIYEQNLPCISLRKAIEAGLLPVVKGYERFDNQI
jgi:hypothetical protein